MSTIPAPSGAAPASAAERVWITGQTPERVALDPRSWVDVARGWLADPDEVYAALAERVSWRQGTVWRYDHSWSEPRLSAWCRPGPNAPHPSVTAAHKALRKQYGVDLDGASLCWYRDGQDSMAPHRDTDLRWCEETVIAILTVGARRPWTLTPRGSRGPAVDIAPGSGDLLVMGGRAQADWLHGVPKSPGTRAGRISLQWRWSSRRGRPERGGQSGAPRNYGGGR